MRFGVGFERRNAVGNGDGHRLALCLSNVVDGDAADLLVVVTELVPFVALHDGVRGGGAIAVVLKSTYNSLGIRGADVRGVGGLICLLDLASEHGDGDGHQHDDDGDDDQHLHQGEAFFVVEFFQHG